MNKVLVDRELLLQLFRCWDCGLEVDNELAQLRIAAAQPAEAEGVEVVAWQQRYICPDEGPSCWQSADERAVEILRRRDDYELRQLVPLTSLSAVTAERDAALAENARLIEDRARFPDKPDDIGNMIRAHIGNLKAGKEQAESYARKWSAEADLLRKDADRWRYVSLQGDDTHWLNLLRVDLEDFGGNINAAVDALIDGEAPAMAAKEA